MVLFVFQFLENLSILDTVKSERVPHDKSLRDQVTFGRAFNLQVRSSVNPVCTQEISPLGRTAQSPVLGFLKGEKYCSF